MSINFPHLGIYLDHVGKFISVNGFHIAYYGIIMGCSILLGLYLAEREAKRTGQNPDTYTDLVIYAIVVSIICARTYYVIFSWDNYKNDLLSIFNLRQGGIAIYGAVIGAVATVRIQQSEKTFFHTDAGYGVYRTGSRTDSGTLGKFLQQRSFRRLHGRTVCHAASGECGTCA